MAEVIQIPQQHISLPIPAEPDYNYVNKISPAPSEAAQSPSIFEDMATATKLLITKRLDLRSTLTLHGKKNRFTVNNQDDQPLYTIEEETKWWVGYLCLGLRPLQLKVLNTAGDEILRIKRPFACTSKVLPCQLQSAEVFASQEHFLGSVEQVWSVVVPEYLVKDCNGADIYKVTGPGLTIGCFSDIQFQIQNLEGTDVGATCKRWRGVNHALFRAPVTDYFGVAFVPELSVDHKALLLATSMLIDYMYYEI